MQRKLSSATQLTPAIHSNFCGLPCDRGDGTGQHVCLYASECMGSSSGPLYFAAAYPGGLLVSLAETSSNLVVRDEQHLLSGELRRPSIRKHVFEGCRLPFSRDTKWITRAIVLQAIQVLQSPQGIDLRTSYLGPLQEVESSMQANDVLSLQDLETRIFTAQLNDPNSPTLLLPGHKSLFDVEKGLFGNLGHQGLPCLDTSEIERLGKYVGYVDLRLSSPESPIAFAVLAPPRHLRHSPEFKIVQSELGTIFGGPAIYGTAFAMVDPQMGGGCCSTAAILMAVANLADRGGRPIGHLDTTAIASQEKPYASENPKCVKNNNFKAIQSIGLDCGEVNEFLKRDSINVSSYVGHVADRELLLKLIKAYVDARCPLLLWVDAKKLWKALQSYPHVDNDFDIDQLQDSTHMVVVVGYSIEKRELVIHDPSYQPYCRVKLDDLYDAGGGSSGPGLDSSILSIGFIASRRIPYHLRAALDRLRLSDEVDQYWYRSILELSQNPTIKAEMELVHRDDLKYWLTSDLRWLHPKLSTNLGFDNLNSLTDDWYWIVTASILDEHSPQQTHPDPATCYAKSFLWIFSAQQEPVGARWNMRAWYQPDLDEPFHFELRRSEESMPTLVFPPLDAHSKLEGDNERTALTAIPESPSLRPSLLTSSSELPLDKLLKLHCESSHVDSIELYLLRRIDIATLSDTQSFDEVLKPRYGLADWISRPGNVEIVYNWVKKSFIHQNTSSKNRAQISAVATFFPGLGSFDRCYKRDSTQHAVSVSALTRDALVSSMKIADKLWRTHWQSGDEFSASEFVVRSDERLMTARIVEIVLGSLLDTCSCDECLAEKESQSMLFFLADWNRKVDEILDQLVIAIKALYQDPEIAPGCGDPQRGFCFAIEIEPGEHSVVNSVESLDGFFARVDSHSESDLLKRHVGLNLDIAHCILCGVKPKDLIKHFHRIVNAHIADHPGMHTRDHVPGTWRYVESTTSIDRDYINILASAATAANRQLPFSFRIGLELESCSSPSWCDAGISTIRRILRN